MRYALVAVAALLLGVFAAGNMDVLTQTFFPGETLVAEISLSDKKETPAGSAPAIQLCSFGRSGQVSPIGPIILNEIAWMGDTESFNNEWIELKNISTSQVDISGWQVLDKDEQIKIILAGEIDSGEFLVLRRGEDFSGNLRNSDEGLRLLDKDCNLVDEALANPDWPAGDNKNKIPMRRAEDFSWYTPGSISQVAAKININTAGYEELQKITGVGPVISGRIIDYRNANGPFGQIEEIKEVKGIGDITFQKMRDEITL